MTLTVKVEQKVCEKNSFLFKGPAESGIGCCEVRLSMQMLNNTQKSSLKLSVRKMVPEQALIWKTPYFS